MKKLLLSFIFIMVVLFNSLAWAGSGIMFTWDPNSETDLVGYRLYQTAIQGEYVFGETQAIASILAGVETVTINVSDGEWWWVLTAVDIYGWESERSNEVTYIVDTTPPTPPTGFYVTIDTTPPMGLADFPDRIEITIEKEK